MRNASSLDHAIIINLTRRLEEGGGKGRDWKRGTGEGRFEGIILCLSLAYETYRYHSATCGCIVELREAVTLYFRGPFPGQGFISNFL
jgi:hypothetical protein